MMAQLHELFARTTVFEASQFTRILLVCLILLCSYVFRGLN